MRRTIHGAVRALEFLGAASLAVLMAVVVVDVVGRAAFDRPLPWGTELLEVVLAVMVFAIYPVLGLRNNHITVDLITVRPALQVVQKRFARLVGFVAFMVVAYCVARQAVRSGSYGDASPLLGIPTADVLWFMCVMAVFAAVAFLLPRSLRERTPGHSLTVE